MHGKKYCTLLVLKIILLTLPTTFSTDNTYTNININNISSNAVQIQHLDLPATSGLFDTKYFIENLSWQPTAIRDVINIDTISQLQPWLWMGAGQRKYETVTTFAAVHCCREDKESDYLETEDSAGRNPAVCALPPATQRRGAVVGSRQVSLWAVLSHRPVWSGCVAMASVTHTIGEDVSTPEFLKDFDLRALAWEQSGLVYLPPSLVVSITPTSLSVSSGDDTQLTPARFVCIVEGAGNVSVAKPKDRKVSSEVPTHFEGNYSVGECIYAPTGWLVSLEAATHTTSLVFTWPDDVIVTDKFLELLENEENSMESHVKENEENYSRETTKTHVKENNGTFLDSFLTEEEDFEKEYLKKLWVKPPVLPHFLRFYYFSVNATLSVELFLEKVKPDSMLLPNLVDCPALSECHYLLVALFRELDLNGDEALEPLDLASLTHENFPTLQLRIDDLVQEIRDLALDQWNEAMEGSSSDWEAFAERASEQRKVSAIAVAKRIQDRELSLEELEILKQSLPELYEQHEEGKSSTELYEQLEELDSFLEDEHDTGNYKDEL